MWLGDAWPWHTMAASAAQRVRKIKQAAVRHVRETRQAAGRLGRKVVALTSAGRRESLIDQTVMFFARVLSTLEVV